MKNFELEKINQYNHKDYKLYYSDKDIEKVFGKGVFYDGGVSPNDKENMNVDVYYVKGLVN